MVKTIEQDANKKTFVYPADDERDRYIGGAVPVKSLKKKQKVKLVKK